MHLGVFHVAHALVVADRERQEICLLCPALDLADGERVSAVHHPTGSLGAVATQRAHPLLELVRPDHLHALAPALGQKQFFYPGG